MSGKLLYQVGELTESGTINQAGGTKAIVRLGWNVWVFGIRTVNVYTAHCSGNEVSHQVCQRRLLYIGCPKALWPRWNVAGWDEISC
jgi:hypothetical protein